MYILGLDLSLTRSGFAHGTEDSRAAKVGVIATKTLRGPERLIYIRDHICTILDAQTPDLVVLEGYIMGRFTGRIADLGELGGVVKTELFERRIPTLVAPPTCLKLFATGAGNADKDRVRAAMAKIRGRLFAYDDEADAFSLYQMGLAFSTPRLRPRDARHFKRRALKGCELVA